MVGQPTRISMYAPGIWLPDPNCEGNMRYFSIFPSHWDVAARPSGSSATLTSVNASEVRLVADKAGQWTVRYTACHYGCRLAGVDVPPLAETINFSPIPVAEGRLSGFELRTGLVGLLADSRIQISHTGNGTPGQGTPVPYTLRWSVSTYKYNQLCVEPPEPAPICEHWDNGGRTGQVTFHSYTPTYNSYIDFGPNAVQAGAPEVLPLPISGVERDVPLEKRAAIMAAQTAANPTAILLGLDIDRILMLANNIHLDLDDTTAWSATIAGGGVNLSVKLDSSDPSIKCIGHFKAKALYYFTLAEGWADELCPDFNMSQMDLSVKLIPAVVNGALTVGDVQVTVQLEPQGVQSTVIDFFVGATNIAEERIASTIRMKLLENQTRTDLGELLTKALRSKFPDLCQVVHTQVIGSELVIQYTTPPQPWLPCTTPGGGVLSTSP
jgi:hypothetical protein